MTPRKLLEANLQTALSLGQISRVRFIDLWNPTPATSLNFRINMELRRIFRTLSPEVLEAILLDQVNLQELSEYEIADRAKTYEAEERRRRA